jgi:lipoic acid synthetase
MRKKGRVLPPNLAHIEDSGTAAQEASAVLARQ